MSSFSTNLFYVFAVLVVVSATLVLWQITGHTNLSLNYHLPWNNRAIDEDKVVMIENNAITNDNDYQPKNCKPKDRVMFLKTHKTGSSTVTNMLNRYGKKYNLTFALPTNRISFAWPNRFKINTVIPLYSNPHLLCNHARYSKHSLHLLFPKDQSTYITILRYPITQYESLFNFMKLWEGLEVTGDNSMDILDKYLLNVTTVKSAKLDAKTGSRLLRNPLMFDLGLDFRYYQDIHFIWQYIQFLEKEFRLVMIMEYFEESVVLLKRLMCWEFDDVVFIKQNERQDKDKRNISTQIELNLKSWNQADFLLYNHFNKTLWKKIAAEGPGFYEDLAYFRKRQKEVFDLCVETSGSTKAYTGKFVKGYRIWNHLPMKEKIFCMDMIKGELPFMEENIAAQKQRLEHMDNSGEYDDIFVADNDWDRAKDLAHYPVFHKTTGSPNK